eukprot:1147386-Amphidinium_carterae.1
MSNSAWTEKIIQLQTQDAELIPSEAPANSLHQWWGMEFDKFLRLPWRGTTHGWRPHEVWS